MACVHCKTEVHVEVPDVQVPLAVSLSASILFLCVGIIALVLPSATGHDAAPSCSAFLTPHSPSSFQLFASSLWKCSRCSSIPFSSSRFVVSRHLVMKGAADPHHTVKRICATNKYAKSSYEIGKKFEAGISLVGTEIGPVASGQCQLRDAYCRVRDGELWIHNLFIGPHKTTGKYFQHAEKRPRRLLVHKKEILELKYASDRDGQTIVPLRIYLTATHRVKVEVAIGRGIKKYDKREAVKQREIKRGFERLLKNY